MNKYLRRAIIGICAGAAGSVVLAHTFDNSVIGLGFGIFSSLKCGGIRLKALSTSSSLKPSGVGSS